MSRSPYERAGPRIRTHSLPPAALTLAPLRRLICGATVCRSDPIRSAIEITATCKLRGRTGVEMEALTAVAVAALTVYDMCKSADRTMRITDIRLIHKSGGKSGSFDAA